ncbi:MAG TPA: DHA2 family efflux MFS transporter permease subunit [bacterium]|nr:DHA2 family efflux MFS transporter permease subunit [bacterium]
MTSSAAPAITAAPDGGTRNKWLVTAAVTVGTLMGTVDTSIVNVALPNIQANYGVTITEVAWISTGYLIALAIVLPLTGWLSSVFGRKRLYQTCLLVFIGASALAGLAPSLPFLIAARVLQGLGAGVLSPTEQTILRETFPPEEQGLATGLYALVVVLGPTIGPLIGGAITDNYTWRWIFFINLPVGIIGSLMVAAFVPDPAHARARPTTVDAVGIGLVSVGLAGLLVVLEQGNEWGWFDSPLVWGIGLTAISCLVLFVLWELLGTDTPAVDLRVLAHPPFAAAWAGVSLMAFGLIGALLLQSLFLQEVLGYTATQTGWAFLPRGLITMCMSPLAGLLMPRVGPRAMATVGVASVTTGVFLMSRWTLDTGPPQILLALMVNGFGLSLLFLPLFTSGLATLDRRRLTGAAGLLSLQLQLGSAFGTAVLATMLQDGMQRYHALLAVHTAPTDPQFTSRLQQLQALAAGRGGDPVAAQHQAAAIINGMISQQASVLAFEHAFQVVLVGVLAMAICIPFFRVPSGRRAAPMH